MMNYVWLAIVAAILSFLAYRGARIWLDAGQRGLGAMHRLGWTLLGAFLPSRYWWAVRIKILSPREQASLLARETNGLGLERADGLRCPLCDAEVPGAWTLAADRRPTVAAGPVECPTCDFRLDACRHCTHFLPGPPRDWGGSPWDPVDLTSGRCRQHTTSQPVEQACAPQVAQQLKARGYEQIRASMPIADSYLPPDSCRAFQPERKLLRANGVRWPDARRTALLSLLVPTEAPETTPLPKDAGGGELWLW